MQYIIPKQGVQQRDKPGRGLQLFENMTALASEKRNFQSLTH